MIPVFDSNILIDLSKGYDSALTELRRYKQAQISLITWIEVLSGPSSPAMHQATEAFMRRFEIVIPDFTIARIAADIRRSHRLKLPDAIIWATAKSRQTLLVTRNSKDFPIGDPTIRIPYTLH